MLNTTIAGGAFKNAAGEWVNANGEKLNDAQIKAAEQHAAETQAHVARLAQQQEAQALMRNPGALALALQLQGIPQPQAAPEPPQQPAKGGK